MAGAQSEKRASRRQGHRALAAINEWKGIQGFGRHFHRLRAWEPVHLRYSQVTERAAQIGLASAVRATQQGPMEKMVWWYGRVEGLEGFHAEGLA